MLILLVSALVAREEVPPLKQTRETPPVPMQLESAVKVVVSGLILVPRFAMETRPRLQWVVKQVKVVRRAMKAWPLAFLNVVWQVLLNLPSPLPQTLVPLRQLLVPLGLVLVNFLVTADILARVSIGLN